VLSPMRATTAAAHARPMTETSTHDSLNRPVENRMLGGVCAGIAAYLDLDPTLVRVAFAALTVLGGAGVPLYAIGWLLIPDEGSDRSPLADLLSPGARRATEAGAEQ